MRAKIRKVVEKVRFPLLKSRKKERRKKIRVKNRQGKGRLRKWPRMMPKI
jgi:hypothetical protein